MNDLFVIASFKKFRFETVKGDVTIEQLCDMPLLQASKNSLDFFHLNRVAQTLYTQIVNTGLENFVDKKTPKNKELSQKLEIVKHIIKIKLDTIKKNADAAENKILRDKARRILADREDDTMRELSDKELKKLAK